MEQFTYILWIVLGVILIIAEIFTLGFVLFWFGVGALAAAFAGWLGLGFGLQFLIFTVVSIALTAMSRTVFSNYFPQDDNALKTAVDSLPGKIGTVTIASQGALHEGAVKVYGSIWTAFPADDRFPLIEGEKVEVVRVQGSSIYVRGTNELAGWREEN
jgi:membrane protein implicated in regulation of membrane protease activity